MKECALNFDDLKDWDKPGMPLEHFESVEFSIDGLNCPHQFRIWNLRPESMCILVKENSEILKRLKVGDIHPLKYYTSDLFCPTQLLKTEIRNITKEDAGRFRGHYLVGLVILEGEHPWGSH